MIKKWEESKEFWLGQRSKEIKEGICMKETSWGREEEPREAGQLFVTGYKQESNLTQAELAGWPASVTQLSYPFRALTPMVVGILCMTHV